MTDPILGIDHFIVLTRDLDRAAAQYRRLGFTVAPRGTHSPHMGTGNHCIMFRRDYMELLGVLQPTDHNRRWRERLARREGPTGIALATADARAAYEALTARGVAAEPPLDFARPVELEAGGTADARFTVTKLTDLSSPLVPMFLCQHHTREVVWQKELTEHANGAAEIAYLMVVVDRPPAGTAKPYAALFGRGTESDADGAVLVRTGTAALWLAPRGHVERLFEGAVGAGDTDLPSLRVAGIAVADLAMTAAVLRTNGVAFRELEDGIVVGPAEAAGAVLHFVTARRGA